MSGWVRAATLAGIALLTIAGAAAPATAQAVGECTQPDPPPRCVQVEIPGEEPGGQPGGEGGGGGGPPMYAWYDLELGETPEGEPCWTYAIVYRPAPPPPERSRDAVVADLAAFDGNDFLHDACPPGEPVFDPAAAAAVFWAGMDPPAATARVRPGKALTGLRAFLELDGPPQLSASTATPLGPLTIAATPTYTVEWGDGSAPTTTTSRGVAWPGGPGEITHVYTDAGGVTITVTTTWEARWRFGGRTGGLPAVDVTSTLDLPVEQVQSVRSR